MKTPYVKKLGKRDVPDSLSSGQDLAGGPGSIPGQGTESRAATKNTTTKKINLYAAAGDTKCHSKDLVQPDKT